MLVLTRKEKESITIAAKAKITIVQIKGKRARFLLQAPAWMKILREKLIGVEAKEPDLDVVDQTTEDDPNRICNLVLTLEAGEKVVLGEEIKDEFQAAVTVTLVDTSSSSISIGLEASRFVPIVRDEIKLRQVA